MKTLLFLLFGYCVFSIPVENYKTVINEAHKNKIRILQVKQHGSSVNMKVNLKDEDTFKKILKYACAEYKTVCRRGMPIVFRKYNYRIGLILGIIFFFTALLLSPKFIWEININGIENATYKEVEQLLYDSGIKLGAFSPLIDRSRTCSEILLNSDKLSWISVNIQGSSANVEILERDFTATSSVKGDAANIIAKKDGYIIDTDIKKGLRIVKDYAMVKKDEILVSGIYDTGKMGTRYVYSEAKISAVINDVFTAEIPLKNVIKRYDKEIVTEKSVKIYGKTINILKNSSLNTQKYDTILREESLPFSLFDRLPITVIKLCVLPYTEVTQTLTEAEALKLARKKVDDIVSCSDYIEILGSEENYFIENGILYFTRTVEAIQDIALTSEFNVN